MTVVNTDRIEMAESDDTSTLDSLFERLAKMPVPEGYRVEIVDGAIHMSPQRHVHWQIIRRIVRALEDRFGMDVPVASDERIDFPGRLNGLCPDVAKLRDGAQQNAKGHWPHQDVEFVAEVISKDTAANDYGPKKTAYATAGVPVYLVVDPYLGRCHVYTQPKDGDYISDLTIAFGAEINLKGTVVDLTLTTDEFPRD
ncbi:Uma2 family endonuclease [Streptomyces sp. BPTC-684]|uniref:Uma2 family endonuclease n=1 Tax=Streptomyces sp. BPTC-684 TaxID=3043734 RepID=UPI0024B1D35A|nr:Uma2 family endonuclease [Streptomyces sp. BPTC-684]WHM38135.1 Uma2 family endonuclease [Streptomyces sp. BPTC-684]